MVLLKKTYLSKVHRIIKIPSQDHALPRLELPWHGNDIWDYCRNYFMISCYWAVSLYNTTHVQRLMFVVHDDIIVEVEINQRKNTSNRSHRQYSMQVSFVGNQTCSSMVLYSIRLMYVQCSLWTYETIFNICKTYRSNMIQYNELFEVWDNNSRKLCFETFITRN